MFKIIAKPTLLILAILLFAVWTLFVCLPNIYSPLPATLLIIIGLFQKKIVCVLKFYLRILAIAAIFLTVIAIALVTGGLPYKEAILHSVSRFGLISTLIVTVIYLSAITKPYQWMILFDKIKVPKKITYLLLTSISSIMLVKDYGNKTVSLLKLKGYAFNSLYAKMTAYIRIITPVFYILFNHLQIHARSLYYRNFLCESIWNKQLGPQWNRGQFFWVVLSIFFITISFLF